MQFRLFAQAYNLGNFLRRLALPAGVKHWSLTTLRGKLIKIGAKIVGRARYVTFQMAEVAIPRDVFRATLARIRALVAGQATVEVRLEVPEPSIPCSRTTETSQRNAGTLARRAGSLTETIESRSPNSYHGSLSFGYGPFGKSRLGALRCHERLACSSPCPC